MGSISSSTNRDGSDDPWWPIENQDLTLNVTPVQTMDSQVNSNNAVSEIILRNDAEHSKIENSIEPNKETVNNSEISDLNSEESEENLEKMSKNTSESDCASASSSSHSSILGKEDKFVSIEGKRSQLKSSLSLDEFKEELRVKREMRKNAITELHNEIKCLRQRLADEKALNKKLLNEKSEKNETKKLEKESNFEPTSTNVMLRSDLANVQLALQDANSEILSLTNELNGTKKQVDSLKEVVSVSKQMVEIRENQLTQLKAKLTEIEGSLAEREMQLMSENLRQEYDRQLTNIRNLRTLYEERARVNAAERENLNRQLETSRAELATEIEKNKNLEEHIASLDSDLKNTSTDLYGTREQLSYYKAENKGLHEEMTVINQLFSQLLAGFSGRNDIDIDKLSHMLEENRELLNDMTSRESCKEGAAQLPKLLFDLVSQVGDGDKMTEEEFAASDKADQQNEDAEKKESGLSSAQDIIKNLPKVWKVLIELLNHQKIDPVDFKENSQDEDCYKSVQTPTGPQMVLSVSKTYIKLKDLILEKKFLQKETHKLKNLNSHLEYRLGQQEKRLGAVTIELNKTWSVVGRMQRQHRQLHTNEQVLRYQLQQKRRLLNELKEELEYCRRKWNQAKEKNKESQSQWDSLRLEFKKRKEQDSSTSAESGYSDGPVSEDEEENVPRPSTPKYESKRKGNKEKFLLKVDVSGKKNLRIHSVSPIRCAKALNLLRRNSESQITQFATETIEAATATIQPAEQYTIEKIEHVSFSIEDIVRMGSPARKLTEDGDNDQVKLTEPVVKSHPKPGPSNAKKLIESKCSDGTRPKMCYELRKKNAPKPSESNADESLEEMFMRLSGQESSSSSDMDTSSDAPTQPEPYVSSQEKTDEARRADRVARIQKLEEQCKSLIAQVMRTSHKDDKHNQQADNPESTHTSLDEAQAPVKSDNKAVSEPKPIVNTLELDEREAAGPSVFDKTTVSEQPKKTDEECLSAREIEYTSRRAERLNRLEEEYKAFLSKVNKTKEKANSVNKKLDSLHERYKSTSDEENVETAEELATPSEYNSTNTVSSVSDYENQEITELTSAKTVNSEAPTSTSSTASASEPSVSNSEEKDMALLTARELEYISKRNERLKRLEEESKAFLERLQKRNERVNNQVDGSQGSSGNETSTTESAPDESANPEASTIASTETEGEQNSSNDVESKDDTSEDNNNQ